MGKVIDTGLIDNLVFAKEGDPEAVKRLSGRIVYLKKLDKVYQSKDGTAIKAVECVLDLIVNSE